MDIDWILEDKIIARKISDSHYHIESFDDPPKVVELTINDKGRYLFNGKDIETESIMGYVGLLDMINDSQAGEPVVLEAEL